MKSLVHLVLEALLLTWNPFLEGLIHLAEGDPTSLIEVPSRSAVVDGLAVESLLDLRIVNARTPVAAAGVVAILIGRPGHTSAKCLNNLALSQMICSDWKCNLQWSGNSNHNQVNPLDPARPMINQILEMATAAAVPGHLQNPVTGLVRAQEEVESRSWHLQENSELFSRTKQIAKEPLYLVYEPPLFWLKRLALVTVSSQLMEKTFLS
mmetsp:Transcript_12664/g.26229  ORF Transcript_12664/g.26229 Transcript_12664/m.26229 type:complete len:209 (-) Transcript_12664:243-869(-)